MKIKSVLIVAILAGTIAGCGSIAKVSVVPNYRAKANRVAVLSFEVSGNPDLRDSPEIADHLATALMDLGLTIVDRQAIIAEANRQHIQLSGIQINDLSRIAQALNIDAVFFGSIQYNYHGPASGIRPIEMHETADTIKGKVVVTKNVSGGGAYSESGGYNVASISARLVSMKTQETLVSGYVPGDYQDALIGEIREKMEGK